MRSGFPQDYAYILWKLKNRLITFALLKQRLLRHCNEPLSSSVLEGSVGQRKWQQYILPYTVQCVYNVAWHPNGNCVFVYAIFNIYVGVGL